MGSCMQMLSVPNFESTSFPSVRTKPKTRHAIRFLLNITKTKKLGPQPEHCAIPELIVLG